MEDNEKESQEEEIVEPVEPEVELPPEVMEEV
jgi:hypothetical protein